MAGTADLTLYKDTLLLLGTAGVVVPALIRLKISPVLGYLIAGALLSPKALGLLATTIPAASLLALSEREQAACLRVD